MNKKIAKKVWKSWLQLYQSKSNSNTKINLNLFKNQLIFFLITSILTIIILI